MSGIAGILNLDGAPVDVELLQKMAQAAAFRGPDGIRYWTGGDVGFAHLALNTTPESLRERQPLCSADGRLCLTADARVDNREELIGTLTSKGMYLEDPTDADLILAAYEVWGADCPKQIIGDFALAIRDGRERRLFLTRDPMGIRPLFYCRRGEMFFFATTISSIIAGLGKHPPLNEPLVVDYLCWWFERWVHQTVYETIFRVPASHSLTVSPEGEHLVRYWAFGSQPGPRYRRDEAYVEHFRELFREAVRCRLRSTTPIGIQVSGGLDSSSVACMADHILAESEEAQGNIRLYSCVFEDFPAADERSYLQAVLDRCQGFPVTRIPEEKIWGFKELGSDGGFRFDEPEISPLRSMMFAPLREARRHECRVMLTGEGGDQVLSASAYWMPELTQDVGVRRIASEFGHFWKRNRWATLRAPIQGLVRSAKSLARPFVPARLLRQRARRLRERMLAARRHAAPAWVNEERIDLPVEDQLAFASSCESQWPSRSARVIHEQLMGGWYAALLSYLNSVGAFMGVEYRLPYLDRRLIDFLLWVPPHLRFVDGLTKVILRRAMDSILPVEVRQRATFAHFSEVADHGLREKERAKVRALLEGVRRSQDGYLDVEKLESAWQVYYDGTDLPTLPLLAPLLLQDWLPSFPAGCERERR